MNINHQILDTLSHIKVPDGGLSLVPVEESKPYEREEDAGIVRVWGSDNSFVAASSLQKSNININIKG